MKMRKHHCARLKHAKGQIFTCGMFGTCSDSVLSPRTPPPALVISNPLPAAAAASAPPPPPPPPPPTAKNNTLESTPPLSPPPPPPPPPQSDRDLPASPDSVAQEKLLSQWDFGLKQQMHQLKEKQSERIKAAAAAAVLESRSAAEELAKNSEDLGANNPAFFKERYVGLVERDLSPFQSSRPAAAAAAIPAIPDQSLDALTKDTACGRFAKASLRSLRVLAEESERNKRAIIGAGVPESLISLLLSSSPEIEKRDILREALALLAALADDEHTQALISQSRLLAGIEADLRRRSIDAWILLCKLSTNESAINSSSTGIFDACVALLKDPSAEAKLVRLALKSMLGICLSKQNRIPAVQAGAVEALLETLVDLHGVDGGEFCSRSGIVVNVERALATLELLCTSSEGRSAICSQPNFISELVGLVLGVSERATEYAAGVLCAVLCENLGSDGAAIDATENANANSNSIAIATATNNSVRSSGVLGRIGERSSIASTKTGFGYGEHSSVQEMALKGGAPAQMLLVMQSDCSDRARRKAAKLLKALHKYGENNTIHSDLASTITY